MKKRLILIALATAVMTAGMVLPSLPVHAAKPVHRIIRVEASQYAYNPGIIRVNPGDTVTIELVSLDVVHGLYLDGYGVSVIADPGQTARVTFVADRTGSFRFRCSEPCGALHPFMIGELKVGRNAVLYSAVSLVGLAALTAVFVLHPVQPEKGI